LRYYERAGLVQPSRSRGNIRMYSQHDIERLRLIQRLIDDLGVNLAGVEVIINLNEHIRELEAGSGTIARHCGGRVKVNPKR